MQVHGRRAGIISHHFVATISQNTQIRPCPYREQYVVKLVPEVIARIALWQVLQLHNEIVLDPNRRLSDREIFPVRGTGACNPQ